MPEAENGPADPKNEEKDTQEAIDDALSQLRTLRTKHRNIILPCLYTILIALLLVLGVGIGSARVCGQVDGFLDDKFNCHLDYNPPQQEPITPMYPSMGNNFTLVNIQNGR